MFNEEAMQKNSNMSHSQTENFLEDREGTTSPEKRKCHRFISVLLKSSIFLNVLLLVGLLLVYMLRHHGVYTPNRSSGDSNVYLQIPESSNLTDQNDDDMVCLPCDYMGDDVTVVDTMYDVILKTSCNHKMCCFKKQKTVMKMLFKIIKKIQAHRQFGISFTDTDSAEPDWWSKRPYSAHLAKKHAVDELIWTKDASYEMTYTQDLQLKNNSVSIPGNARGMYLMYSAVTYDLTKFKEMPQSYHAISKQNPLIRDRSGKPREDVIVMKRHGGAAVPSGQKLHTSFLCGIHKFIGGDQVIVKANSLAKQNFFHNGVFSNYFGIFRL